MALFDTWRYGPTIAFTVACIHTHLRNVPAIFCLIRCKNPLPALERVTISSVFAVQEPLTAHELQFSAVDVETEEIIK
jgi:hypothetical protein